MGGRPLFALNVAGWPRETLPLELLAEVLRGGRDVAKQAGMIVVGGHTVDDEEPKYGMCVLGRVDPDRLMRLDGARAGDVLVLTKAIGTGIVTTAIKADAAPSEAVEAAVASMTDLNDRAAEVLVEAGVRGCTDVTGFGLVGHLHRLLSASGAAADLDPREVEVLPGARELAAAGHVPGGTKRNVDAFGGHVDWGDADETVRMLLCDAQTSGGLLAAVPEGAVEEVLRALEGSSVRLVGRVVEGEAGRIRLVGASP